MSNNVAVLTLFVVGVLACGWQVGSLSTWGCSAMLQKDTLGIAPHKAYQLWKEKSDKVIIIDVRTPSEYQGGHVRGAINLDYYANFEAEVQKLPKNKIYILHCVSGRRSGEATAIMRRLGYEAYNMGGFGTVRKAGFPTE